MERTALKDFWKREFKYLRLSVTEVCNFRCTYCLPNGYQPNPSTSNPLMMKPQFLSVAEIQNLASAFSDLGIKKVRLTGGEPTLRQDLAQIISVLKNTPAIQTVALTTNAWNLDKKLSEYKSVGLDQLNISLDSLNAETFFSVTGKDLALKIKSFIDQALQMNFESVKLNVVLLKGINDQEIPQFMDWVKDRPLDVRFIELMRLRYLLLGFLGN